MPKNDDHETVADILQRKLGTIKQAPLEPGSPSWDDVVIEVKPTETTSILIGNIKATGLENLTSTRFTTFMDRGPYGDFGVDSYLLSVVGKVNGYNWSVTGAVQGVCKFTE